MTLTLAAIFSLVSAQHQLPSGLLSALCFVESSHRTHVVNHKDGGSRSNGLCQIKYNTAKQIGYKGTEAQLMDPMTNATWAAIYLRKQLDRYGDTRYAIAAYNAGSLRLDMTTGTIRNQKYVTKVYTAWSEGR